VGTNIIKQFHHPLKDEATGAPIIISQENTGLNSQVKAFDVPIKHTKIRALDGYVF
jgi:hypothetical protein